MRLKFLPYILIGVSLFVNCDDVEQEEKIPVMEFNIEPRLDPDANGYYHLPLTEGSWQTLHRISGHIYQDGQPVDVVRFNWTSSHYWILGDTLGYIINRTVNDEGVYVALDTSYVIGFKGFEVATINCCSYSNAEGEVNTMFAPVWSMRHDTVTVWVNFYDNEGQIQENTIEIVLD